jgi:hypothetical protein
MSEFEAAKSLSDEARMIFKALNFNEKEYGVFKRASIYNKNGFNIEFDNDLEVRFQIYKADGGRFLVVLSKKEGYFKSLGEKFWYYENGQFTPAKIDIPAPHYYKSEDECMYYFTDEGLEWTTTMPTWKTIFTRIFLGTEKSLSLRLEKDKKN